MNKVLTLIVLSLAVLASSTCVHAQTAKAPSANTIRLFTSFGFTESIQGPSARYAYQCVHAGIAEADLGQWSGPRRFNADDGWGGCYFGMAVIDPKNELAGLKIFLDLAYGDEKSTGECSPIGSQEVPVINRPVWDGQQTYAVFDTDSRPSWCKLTFRVTGRNDVELDIKWHADDSGVDQCVNRDAPPNDFKTAKVGQPVWIGMNTDNRFGGCVLTLKLRKIAG